MTPERPFLIRAFWDGLGLPYVVVCDRSHNVARAFDLAPQLDAEAVRRYAQAAQLSAPQSGEEAPRLSPAFLGGARGGWAD